MTTQAEKDAAVAVLVTSLDAVDASGKNVSTYNGDAGVVGSTRAFAAQFNAGIAALTAAGLDPAQTISLLNASTTSLTNSGAAVRALLNAAKAIVVPPPVVIPPAPTGGAFVNATQSKSYNDFWTAHDQARDGDTILVAPQLYVMQRDGFTITKCLTVMSAVPGQRYSIVMSPDSTGALGSGINIDAYQRQKNGLPGRLVVAINDVEVSATVLTYQRGKTAIWIDTRSGCDVDFVLLRGFLHDYDEGLECGNQYDPNERSSTIQLLNSIVYRTGGISNAEANHSIYVGMIASLLLRGTIVHNQAKPNWTGPTLDASGNVTGPPNYWPVGHLVKSRAKSTTIDACRLTGQDATNSNCVEYGDGGDLLIQGSLLEQGSRSDGNALVSYGRFYPSTEPTDVSKIISNDGRTNRLRMYQNTLVNSAGPQQQFVELSYHTTQAYWDSVAAAGQVRPPLATDIKENLFVGPGFTPDTGNLPAPSGNSAFGIACANAADNTRLALADLVDYANRYSGWAPKVPIAGQTNYAQSALVDVTP